MKQLTSIFSPKGYTALIPYITVGYPSIEDTLKVVSLLAQNGSDMVELGIPFSDPLADGVTIQRASFHALRNGVTPKVCLEVAERVRRKTDIPLLFMTYFNPVLSYGCKEFCLDSASAGISGLIIPDLPPDEALEFESIARKHGLHLIYLLAPTSTEERMRLITQRSSGFIYVVSLTGVTGGEMIPATLETLVAKVRKFSSLPLCVGFGISTLEQARRVASIADGVIIGSQIIRLMEAGGDFEPVSTFIKGVRLVLDEVSSEKGRL